MLFLTYDRNCSNEPPVNLPFKYKQDGDLYGIQADILSPIYFAVENNNLQDLLLKLGATDVSGMPNRIEPTVIE